MTADLSAGASFEGISPKKKTLKNQLKAGSQPASSEFFLGNNFWGESIARFSHVSVVILRVVVFLGS